MKANKIAMLGIAALLGSTVYGNVRVIKAENNQLEEGLDAIEDAIGKGKDSDSENNSQSASKGETDMQEVLTIQSELQMIFRQLMILAVERSVIFPEIIC